MTTYDDPPDEREDAGYGAAEEGSLEDAPDQAQSELREPPSEEESELDDYAQSQGDAV